MGRGFRKHEPPVKPVIKAELSERHFKLRLVLAIVFGLFAAVMIVYGIFSLLNTEPGWQQIEAKTTEGTTCAGEFSFYYYIGEADITASAEYKQLVNAYTEAARHAYCVFDSTMAYAGIGNLYTLNQNIDQTVTLDPLLYDALLAMKDQLPYLFLAPAYADYRNLFACTDDTQLYPFVASENEEEAAYLQKIAAFATDSESISLDFLGNNTVCLHISDEYAAFADEYGIVQFVDFFYMQNAFVIDYLAEQLASVGFTRGVLSSYDGYSRNLDSTTELYSLPIYHLKENTVYSVAEMQYTGPMSIVYLRAYPLNNMDFLHYYTREDGNIYTAYVDLTDGISRTSIDTLIGYSETLSCVEILKSLLPCFIGTSFHVDDIGALQSDLHMLYMENDTVYYGGNITLQLLHRDDGMLFQTEKYDLAE